RGDAFARGSLRVPRPVEGTAEVDRVVGSGIRVVLEREWVGDRHRDDCPAHPARIENTQEAMQRSATDDLLAVHRTRNDEGRAVSAAVRDPHGVSDTPARRQHDLAQMPLPDRAGPDPQSVQLKALHSDPLYRLAMPDRPTSRPPIGEGVALNARSL